MSLASPNSLVNLGPIVTPDANSPFAPATADAGSVHPLAVPEGAKGLVVFNTGAAADLAEFRHNTTKGDGMVVPSGRTVFSFNTDMEGGTLFINRLAGATPLPSIFVHYFF